MPSWTPDIRRHEVNLVVSAFSSFFCLLCGYYVLRPLRDTMGLVAGGESQLPWLFTATLLAMLVASPAYALAARHLTRRGLVRLVHHVVAASTLVFFALLATHAFERATAHAFFVWVSVYNVFVVSVFWSVMTDALSSRDAKRLFGCVAAGGSLGALVGPLVTAALAERLSVGALLLVSAVLVELSRVCLMRALAWSIAHPRNEAPRTEVPVGHGVGPIITPLFRSPYFAGLALYVLLLTVGQTFLYLQQVAMVAAASSDAATRTALFARIDLAVNVATLLAQLLVTGQVFARFGLTVGLLAVPLITAAGFLVLLLTPGLAALAVFQAARRAAQYAIERPGREVLYTVVQREQRYTAKNFIDTVVFRSGDALSGWLREGLRGAGAGVVGMSLIAATLSVFWGGLAVGLARQHGDQERVLG